MRSTSINWKPLSTNCSTTTSMMNRTHSSNLIFFATSNRRSISNILSLCRREKMNCITRKMILTIFSNVWIQWYYKFLYITTIFHSTLKILDARFIIKSSSNYMYGTMVTCYIFLINFSTFHKILYCDRKYATFWCNEKKYEFIFRKSRNCYKNCFIAICTIC